MSGNTNPAKSYLYWLDTLRFIAALMVLMGHTRNDFFLRYDLLPLEQQGIFATIFYFILRLGHEAVIVFFILSGFLVGGKGLLNIRADNFDSKNYIIDRIVRIGLPLIGCISFYYITHIVIGTSFSWLTALGNLFSLQGVFVENLVSPFWSLAYEVWFYVILLAIAFIYRRQNVGGILLFICILVFTKLEPLYLLIWFMGAIAYIIIPPKTNKWILGLGIVGTLISIVLCQFTSASIALKSFTLPISRSVSELILAFFFCIVVQQVIHLKPSSKVTKNVERNFSRLAKFSYTLYLSHRITSLWFFHYGLKYNQGDLSVKGILTYIGIITICLIVSFVLYLLFEYHTYRVKLFIKTIFNNKYSNNSYGKI